MDTLGVGHAVVGVKELVADHEGVRERVAVTVGVKLPLGLGPSHSSTAKPGPPADSHPPIPTPAVYHGSAIPGAAALVPFRPYHTSSPLTYEVPPAETAVPPIQPPPPPPDANGEPLQFQHAGDIGAPVDPMTIPGESGAVQAQLVPAPPAAIAIGINCSGNAAF
jgi:hypothetical protein